MVPPIVQAATRARRALPALALLLAAPCAAQPAPAPACAAAGEPTHWIADYCMLKMETDDEIAVSGCIDEESKAAFPSPCASNLHFKRRLCEGMVGAGTVEQCVKDPAFKGRTVEDGGVAGHQAAFWSRLSALCGRSFRGRLTEGTAPTDAAFRDTALVMHVRACTRDEIRIPFHAGQDRSRTWIVTRTAQGLRLKHDHRHEDGTEDRVSRYGGDTRDAGLAGKQEFFADAFTAQLLPAARANVWTIEILPGRTFAYALRREGTDRRFRVEFDLGQARGISGSRTGGPLR